MFVLLLFQISVSFASDICQFRFRYLSVSSQISVSFVLDVYYLQIRYHKKLQPLLGYIIIRKRCLLR